MHSIGIVVLVTVVFFCRNTVVCNYVYLVVMRSVMSLEMPPYIFNLLSLSYSGYKWNDFRSNNLTSSIECSSGEQVDYFCEALSVFLSLCNSSGFAVL